VAIAGLPLPTLIRTVDVHFVGLQESLANGPVGGALQRWFWRSEIGRLRRFEIGFLRAAKAPVTISVDDEHLLRRNGVEHIRTIPPPMPLPPAPAIDRTPGGARHVLFVGRLDLSVNRQALFAFVDEIWPRVDPGCRDRVRVVFAGGVPDREVFQRAGKAGISVRPSPSSAELKSLFNRADVILGPVTTGTGIKIKTLEAMAYGKAVVGFPNAFRGIPAKHDRHALIARSAGEFVELFELAISDHVLRRRLGEAARSLVGTSFNPSKLGARLIEAYANVQVDRATRVRRESRGRRCVAERNTHEQIA
jgi:glycosyltransferase involved in cell wall biosynthesis